MTDIIGQALAVLRDVTFITLEALILYYVRLEWLQGKKLEKITKEFQDHQMEKYKRYKHKKLTDKIKEL